MNKFDQIQALLGLTEKEKSQILSINMANNPSRLYKEVWIGLGGTQSAVYATEVSAEEYLAYTTEETEKVEVYRLAEKLGDDIEAAIRQLALPAKSRHRQIIIVILVLMLLWILVVVILRSDVPAAASPAHSPRLARKSAHPWPRCRTRRCGSRCS